MTNAQRVKALAIGRETKTGHAPLRWVWPKNNCFFTGIPLPERKHPNAHKCNFTPLPGCACKRAKKRARALQQRSGARVA